MDKYQTTVGTFDKLASRYQDTYMEWEFYRDTYDHFCDLIEQDDAEILEIACGPGNITRHVLSQRPGFRIHGIDLAPSMIELARQNIPTASFDVMDGRDITSIQGAFDAILCGFYVPYIAVEDVLELISESFRLLNPGGVFHLSAIEGNYAHSGYQESAAGDRVYTHYYSADFLTRSLESAGFMILDMVRKAFPDSGNEPTDELFFYASSPGHH